VFCGAVEGMLDPSRFGPGCKSRCIEHRGRWLTPPEFEQLAGMSKHYRWRRNIKTETGTRFGELMKSGFLTECAKNCNCDVCDGGVSEKPASSTVLTESTSLNVSRDNDSDSGISTVSSTKHHHQVSML
jgi:SAND domain